MQTIPHKQNSPNNALYEIRIPKAKKPDCKRLLEVRGTTIYIWKKHNHVPGSVSFLDSSRRTRYRIHMIHTSALANLVEYETGKIEIQTLSGMKTHFNWCDKNDETLSHFFKTVYSVVVQHKPPWFSLIIEPNFIIKDENVFYGVTCAIHDLLDHFENTQNQVLTKHWKYYLESFYQDLPDEITWFLKFGARPCVIDYIMSNDFSPLKNKTFLAMLLCVASMKCTRSIKLSAVDLTSECIEVLGTTLDEVPSIYNLEISRCRFPSLCTEQLAQLLVCGKNLTSLVLCDNRVVNDRVMKLFHSLTPKFSTQLQVLRLSGCNLSVTGLEALASTLTSLDNKTEDSISFTALTELDLSHNNLVGAKPQALMHLFACSPHLSVIRLAYCGSSLEWLPSALSRGCRNVLKVLDISGNDFDHFPTNEWHALFATTINLEQLSLCSCQGPYLGETIKIILCGLSRLQGRAKDKRLSVALTNNQLGRPGAKPLSYHILLLADLLTELDLSECGLGDHALDVFNSLEACVNLETLTLNGPWTGLSANVQRSIMISLSNLLKTPNCHLRHLSLSNVDLGENVLYLLADLLNYPSLEDLDLSGNRMGDGVAHILARLISARSNRLRFLHFDRNQLSLTAIEELVQAAATNESHVKLRVPLYDLMTHLNHNEVMCYELTSKIEALYTPKSKLSSAQWWTNWAESENIQTTIHCVTRLSHNTRQLYSEVQKRSKSLSGVHGLMASIENGTDHENGNNDNNVRRWLNDADHVKDLLNKFIATAQDYIEDFIKRSSDLIISRMQSGIESHLEHLGLSMRETAQRICSTQGDAGSLSVRELIKNAQNRVSKGLKEVVQSKFLPELEKQLNKVSSDLISSMFDAVVGDIIDGLDNSHRQLISQLCPDTSKLRSTTRLSVRTQWLQSRSTQETSASRRYPIDEFLSKRQLIDSDDSQNDNQMLLRGLGIRMKSPKASPIHAILTASSTTHVVGDKQSASESKYLSLPTLGVQLISVSGKQKSTSLHHSSFTKSDVVLTKVHAENKTGDVDSEFQSNVTSSSPTPTPPLRRKHIDRGSLTGQQSMSTSQESENSVITVWRRNDLTSSRIHPNRNPRVDSVRLEPLRFFNLVRPKLANYLPSSLDEDIESTDDDVLYSNSTKDPVAASQNARKSDEPNSHTRLQRIKSDPELELVDSAPTELYYTPCSNPESTKPWETHDINILKNQSDYPIPPVKQKDPDSIKIVKKSGPSSTTTKSKLELPQKKEHLYDDSNQIDDDTPIIVERPSNPQPPNRLLSGSSPVADRDEANTKKITSSGSESQQQQGVTEDLVRTILIPRFSPMPMKAGSVESLVTRKQSAYFARLRLLFEEGFGNTSQDRDILDQLNSVSKEDSTPSSYPLQKPALPTTVKEFTAPVKKPNVTKQFQGISSSAEVKDEGKKMNGNSTRKVFPELPLKPSDIRRSVPQSPSESGTLQRPSLGQMGFIRPKRPRTHNLRPQSPKPPVIGIYSPDEDLFKISKSPASGSNSSPGRPFRTQPFALTSQIDKTNWNRRPSFVPRGSDLITVAEPPEPDADTDDVSGRVIKVGGVPMPGLIGPEASSLLARIKQKQMHVSEPTAKVNSTKISDGNSSEVNEIQRALTALKSKTVRQEKEPKTTVSTVKKTEG